MRAEALMGGPMRYLLAFVGALVIASGVSVPPSAITQRQNPRSLSRLSRVRVVPQPQKAISNCLRVSSIAGQAHVFCLNSPQMVYDGLP